MGSSGSGSFSDYSKRQSSPGLSNGGTSGEDKCLLAFSASLEDVSRGDYFLNNHNVPQVGTEIRVVFDRRLIIQTLTGENIGYLPTRFNYIRLCMEQGHEYVGIVSSSSTTLFPSVVVDIIPE